MRRTVKNQFEPVLASVINDDRTSLKALLKKYPSLSTRTVEKAWMEVRIPHWVYAGDTVLHIAAAGYRTEIARMLLEAGADANAAGNMRRSRPLHYAADGCIGSSLWDPKRQVAMIWLLLEAGAAIDAQDKNGATALHRAVRTRCAEAVKALLDAGADARLKNLPGSTPFHLAVQNTGRGGSGSEIAKAAQGEIIRAFLERDIGPALKDTRGKSVSDWARSEWIREMLVSA
jgi:ankyrin repeat protein